jgi:hypothetical protein
MLSKEVVPVYNPRQYTNFFIVPYPCQHLLISDFFLQNDIYEIVIFSDKLEFWTFCCVGFLLEIYLWHKIRIQLIPPSPTEKPIIPALLIPQCFVMQSLTPIIHQVFTHTHTLCFWILYPVPLICFFVCVLYHTIA